MTAGVDEAGRGALAGDVFAAAVILNPDAPIIGLDDSKKVSPSRRKTLETEILARSLSWSVAQVSVRDIERINILQASLLAMQKAIKGLRITPQLVRVDGNHEVDSDFPCEAVIGGDAIHAEISAASILAKQARDRYMQDLSVRYPGYGFELHKGYPTRSHRVALQALGVSEQHRRTYAPIRSLLVS